MAIDSRVARGGYTDMSIQLIERGGLSHSDLLTLAIDDAKKAAGLTDEPYYVRIGVIELLPAEDADDD